MALVRKVYIKPDSDRARNTGLNFRESLNSISSSKGNMNPPTNKKTSGENRSDMLALVKFLGSSINAKRRNTGIKQTSFNIYRPMVS